MVVRLTTIALCSWLLLQQSHAQSGCFTRIALDRHSIYIQQPFKVTITVLTTTWFTAPLDFDNIQVPNAFVLPFDRTVPGMFTINGKQYAGLQFYYIVFPYTAGSFVFPPVHITAQTPLVPGSTSKKVVVQTTAQHYTVKPVPQTLPDKNWLVAKNVTISERWNKPLHTLKVGDVVERTISIYARGTLPQFIPPLSNESLAFASAYLQEPDMRDARNEYDANGQLTQSIVYLLEKEGDFTFPAITVKWWNPLSSKLYTRSATARTIHVLPNAHLGILATLQDSLAATQSAAPVTPVKKQVRTIAGLPWYRAMVAAIALLAVLCYLVKLLIRLWKKYKATRALYLAGERHAFRRFLRSSLSLPSLLRATYTWWDKLSVPQKSPSLSLQLKKQQYPALLQEVESYLQQWYQAQDGKAHGTKAFKKEMKAYRKRMKHQVFVADADRVAAHQRALLR